MAIGRARRRAVDSPMISSRTGCELTDDFLFSFGAGPVLRCTWARHGISGGAILNCTRHQSMSMHIAAAIPNINEVFW